MAKTLKKALTVVLTLSMALSMGMTAGAEEVNEVKDEEIFAAAACTHPTKVTRNIGSVIGLITSDSHGITNRYEERCTVCGNVLRTYQGDISEIFSHSWSSWSDLGHSSPTSPTHRWSRSCGVCGYSQTQTANCGTGGAHLSLSAPLPPLEIYSEGHDHEEDN